MTRRPSYHYTFLTASAFVFATCAMGATSCDDLSKLSLPQTAITMAASITPGTFTPPALMLRFAKNFLLRMGELAKLLQR